MHPLLHVRTSPFLTTPPTSHSLSLPLTPAHSSSQVMCQEAVSRGCFGVAKEALVRLHTALMAKATQQQKGAEGREGAAGAGAAGGSLLTEGKVLRLLIRCILDEHRQRQGEAAAGQCSFESQSDTPRPASALSSTSYLTGHSPSLPSPPTTPLVCLPSQAGALLLPLPPPMLLLPLLLPLMPLPMLRAAAAQPPWWLAPLPLPPRCMSSSQSSS